LPGAWTITGRGGKRPRGRVCSRVQSRERRPIITVNATRHGDAYLPRITVQIGGKEVVALIDTGATHNLIRTKTVQDEKIAPTYVTRVNTAIAEIRGNIRGSQKLRCTFGKVQITSEFLVTDDLVETVLLGYPFLLQHRAILDFQRGCLHIGAEERATIFFSTSSTKRPQSLREGLAPVAPKEVPAVKHVQHDFPKQLESELHQLLHEFRDVFNNDPTPTTTATTKHTIHLRDYTPFRVRPYRYSDTKKLLIDEQVEQMLADGIIEPATSEYAVMPYGLKGAPSTFQRLMCQEVLPGHLRKFAMVYLDDIIIYSQSHEEHLKHLRLVLERLQIHGLCCAPQKCHLGAKKINYLGHVVTDQGNYPQEHHLQQIQSATPPKDRRSLRSFLGLCNWLRDYVPNFADLAYPLTDLLGQKKPYRWGTLEQEAFESVKGALSAPLMLHRPDPNKTFVLQTDASGVGMAAVLYQEDGANRRVISYSSARFNKTERRYHSNEQKCLAVVWAIRRYRPYLEDKQFILRTDNKALVWLQQMKDQRAKLTRWAIELQGYQCTIQHCPGRENQLADILSRDPEERLPQDEDLSDTDRLLPPEPTPFACPLQIQTLADEVRQGQRDDAEFTARMVALRQVEDEPQDRWQRTFRRLYTTRDNLLFGPGGKLYVPTNVRLRVLYENHGRNGANNQGRLPLASTLGRRQGLRAPLLAVRPG
jgi:predicted aspartyl protease